MIPENQPREYSTHDTISSQRKGEIKYLFCEGSLSRFINFNNI